MERANQNQRVAPACWRPLHLRADTPMKEEHQQDRRCRQSGHQPTGVEHGMGAGFSSSGIQTVSSPRKCRCTSVAITPVHVTITGNPKKVESNIGVGMACRKFS